MTVVDTLPCHSNGRFPFGDADHDGLVEFYAHSNDLPQLLACEYIGNDQFILTALGQTGWPWWLGDPDRDGIPNLVAQHYEDQLLSVYECPDSLSLPTRLSWERFLSQTVDMSAIVSDLDRDSAPEVLACGNDWVQAFENTGDDQYELRYFPDPIGPGGPNDLAETHDLDRDGRPELVVGQTDGKVAFCEATANDTIVGRAVLRIHEWDAVVVVAAANDLDGNGRPEALAVAGSSMGSTVTVFVFESPSDDSFEVVWSGTFPGRTGHGIAVGDVDGDSVCEFAVSCGDHVRLFRATAPGQYEVVWESGACRSRREVGLLDIDGDGRDELLHQVELENHDYAVVVSRYAPSGIAEREAARLRAVEVSPSVLRPGAGLRLSGLPPDARVELLDVSGRVRFSSCSSLIPLPSSLAPGLFFVRVGSGSHSITRKVLIVE